MSRIKINIPEEATHIYRTEIQVLISHINYGKHVGNDSLVSILHEARLQFIKNKCTCDETNIDENIGLVVTSLSINYLLESFYGDNLVVDIFVSDITKKTCDFNYKVTKNFNSQENVIAMATTCLLFIDFKNKKPVEIPDKFFNAITATANTN